MAIVSRPRLLVCGGREWDDAIPIRTLLLAWHVLKPVLVHGGARGADKLADTIARGLTWFDVEPFPADWRGHGKAAGPIRNKLMIEQRPEQVWAFKDGFDHTLSRGGTENMVSIAKAAGIPTYVVSHG